MTLLAFVPGAAALAAIISSAPPPPAAPDPIGAVRSVLTTGLRLTTVPRPDSALVAIDLRVRVGSGDETSETSGYAHLLEHLLFKGTANRAPGEIDQIAERLGGEIGARTFRDSTQYTLTVPAAKWRDALSLLSELVLKPTLSGDALDAERSVIAGERALADTDPARIGIAGLAERLFPDDDPYRLPLMGVPETVASASAESVRAFHTKWYRPDHMSLTIVGPVDTDEVEAATAGFFAGERSRPVVRPARPVAVPGPGAPLVRRIDGIQNATLLLGWRTPAPGPERNAALAALVELLVDGDQGILGDALLGGEKPLALRVWADALVQRVGGVLAVTVVASPKQVSVIPGAVDAALQKLARDGVDAAQLAAAVRAARGRLAADRATVEGTARRIGLYEGVDAGPVGTSLDAELDRLTPRALQDAVAALLRGGPTAQVVVEPAGEAAP